MPLTPEVRKGAYCEGLGAGYDDEMFLFDFLFKPPESKDMYIVSRILCTPYVAKNIVRGMNKIIEKYEKDYGKIKISKKQNQK